jgi:hypothetical protein
LSAALLAALFATSAAAQRPRPVEQPQPQEQEQPDYSRPAPPPPPRVVPAKYMGGYGGLRQKREGMLAFDERNKRLVFLDKQEREVLSIAYEAVEVAFADSETRRLMGEGTRDVVLGTAGPLGLPGLLFKKKFLYLTIQFEDPDTALKGVTQFKLNDRETIDSVAHALAQKAGLLQRGQIYVRKKNKPATTEPASAEKPSNP